MTTDGNWPRNPLTMPGMTVTLYGAAPYDDSPRIPDVNPWAPPVFTPIVQPPPSYAANPELAAIAAIEALPEDARARVLRYLVSKFGPVTP